MKMSDDDVRVKYRCDICGKFSFSLAFWWVFKFVYLKKTYLCPTCANESKFVDHLLKLQEKGL